MPALEHNPEGNHALPTDEYIRQNFEPSDRLAVLVLNRENGRRVQRVVTAQALATEVWQRWLRHENAIGGDIYISQNALRENTRNRKKEDIAAIRHVYLDLDHDGAKSLAAIESSPHVPKPSYVVTSSPGKYQVIWKVEGMTQDQAESLQRRMVQEFGADPAATGSSRKCCLSRRSPLAHYNGGTIAQPRMRLCDMYNLVLTRRVEENDI